MNWILKQKNILDEPADVLVCSANVNLLLTGGIGAELVARYGTGMQEALQKYLRDRSPRCAQQGEIIPYTGDEMPYQTVLNAVAIDGWYESSPEIITDVVRRALKTAADKGARKVALAALATGFGRLTLRQFADGIRPILSEDVPPIEDVVICLLLDFELAELARHLPGIKLVQPADNKSRN